MHMASIRDHADLHLTLCTSVSLFSVDDTEIRSGLHATVAVVLSAQESERTPKKFFVDCERTSADEDISGWLCQHP